MSIDMQAITDALVSHAQLVGKFDKVNTSEPKTAPGNGLTCAVWAQSLSPHAQQSGLSATSAYLVMQVRIYDNMLRSTPDEADQIDPNMLAATDDLIRSLSGEFTLAGLVEAIDLLGIGGEMLRAESGYVQIGGQGSGMYRIMTVTVPMIISDAWTQVA
jgi:hypothetical protein